MLCALCGGENTPLHCMSAEINGFISLKKMVLLRMEVTQFMLRIQTWQSYIYNASVIE
jgi:hypothetical protein